MKNKIIILPMIIAIIGIVIIILFAIIPPFNDWSLKCNSNLFADYGNFIGGLAGSLLLFSSIILLYLSLINQKKASEEQIKQIVEDQNQREKQYRGEKFIETFFNMVNYYNDIVLSIEDFPHNHKSRDLIYLEYVEGSEKKDSKDSIIMQLVNGGKIADYAKKNDLDQDYIVNLGKGRLFLTNLYLNMKGAYDHYSSKISCKSSEFENIIKVFNDHLAQYGHLLNNYFHHVFSILEFISSSTLLKSEKDKYSDIFFKILSSNETMLVFYYAFYNSLKHKEHKYKNLLIQFYFYKYINNENIYFHEDDKENFFNNK